MALDDPEPSVLVEEPRPDERDEDREDDTDRAVKMAREHVIYAIEYLAAVMRDERKLPEERTQAATVLLEVAGCL